MGTIAQHTPAPDNQNRGLQPTLAYGWACRPLLDSLAGLDVADRERVEQAVRCTAMGVIARAQEAEALRPRICHRALADAESLWRTWRAIQEAVARHMAEGASP